jgi:hypothetical protein
VRGTSPDHCLGGMPRPTQRHAIASKEQFVNRSNYRSRQASGVSGWDQPPDGASRRPAGAR